jgi:hypothetical protein
MRARLVPIAALLAVFSIATVAYTWPLVRDFGGTYVYPRAPHALARADHSLNSWILAWGAHALRTDPLGLFDANFYYPIPKALVFSEHLLGGTLLVLPIDILGANPVTLHNALLCASFVLGGTGAALLIRELGGSFVAALLGGAVFAFGPPRLMFLDHVQVLASHWMPFALLFLHRFLRTGRLVAGLAFALCLLLQALTSVYQMYYFGIGIGWFLALHAALRIPVARGAYWRALVLGGLVLLLLTPIMLPYVDMRERFGLVRQPVHLWMSSAVGESFLGALLSPVAYLRSRYLGAEPRVPGLIGITTACLSLLGLWAGATQRDGGRRVAWLYLCFTIGLALLSMGPSLRMEVTGQGIPGPYGMAVATIPGFDALRVPVRACVPAFLGIAVLAGLGTHAMLERARTRSVHAACVALLTLVTVAECWREPLHVAEATGAAGRSDVHRWLAAQPGDFAIVELPLGDLAQDAEYMVHSSMHWKRLVNGHSGFRITLPYLDAVLRGFPDDASLRFLHATGVRYAIVHQDLLGRPLCERLNTRRERFLAVRHIDRDSCAVEILGAPESPKRHGRRIPNDSLRLTTSTGDDAGALVDADLETHWVQPVDAEDSWLQIELPHVSRLSRIALRLGSHFGEYLRLYRVETSRDGTNWTTLVADRLGEPPLRTIRRDPNDLVMDIPLPPTDTRYVRLVRAGKPEKGHPWLFVSWPRWGGHELELYEMLPAHASHRGEGLEPPAAPKRVAGEGRAEVALVARESVARAPSR